MKNPRCLNPTCSLQGNVESSHIIRYGFYRTTAGKRRRYRCVGCGQAFSTTKGTPYYRLQHRRTTFDTVVTLRVEGVSLSAIARIERLAWNTVARWLERAAAVCRRFSHGRTTGFVAKELQADEIRSFTGGKTRPTWVFAAIEVWSRLWPSTVVGRRSYRNTLALVRDVATRMEFAICPLIVTDGFKFYRTVIRRVFGPAALYAQVIKTRRHDRVVRVDRRAVIGAAWRFDDALTHSEDSSTVNTSFIERLNLTIRQSSAYLSRRTLSHARSTDTLEAHLELTALLLQLRSTAWGAEVWTRDADSSDAGGTRHTAADPSRHLRVLAARCLAAERRAGVRRLAQDGRCCGHVHAGRGVTTLDDGSTHLLDPEL